MAFYKSKTRFEPLKDGFHGVYWENKQPCDCAMILMLGDDCEDFMGKAGAKWALKRGINAMTMSPAKKDYGHHSYPMERLQTAVEWLKAHGNRKIGVAGASTTGMVALVAASLFHDITLTIAVTPPDFIMGGFMQEKRDGCREWPTDGESSLSWQGKQLPYLPYAYKHPDYWHMIDEESKRTKNMVSSIKLFEDSEKKTPVTEDMKIKVENIKGKLLLIGAKDDVLWDTCRYIGRMDERLKTMPHECEYETLIYSHGTHFIFPSSMLKTILPIGGQLFVSWAFSDAKAFPKECKASREDLDGKVIAAIEHWKK